VRREKGRTVGDGEGKGERLGKWKGVDIGRGMSVGVG